MKWVVKQSGGPLQGVTENLQFRFHSEESGELAKNYRLYPKAEPVQILTDTVHAAALG